MTTIAEARTTLYTEYETNATAITPATQLTFENEAFDKPVGVPWVRMSVQHAEGGQESLGGVGARKFNREGSIFHQIFLVQDRGVGIADPIAQEIRTLFEGKTLTGVRTFHTDVREIGVVDGFYLVNCETTFEFTEIR